MNSRCRHEVTTYLNEIKTQYANQRSRLQQLDLYANKRLKVKHQKSGRDYFSVFDHDRNTYKYLGTENSEEVRLIKEAHYLKTSIQEIQCEIQLIEHVLRMSRSLDYNEINQKLKKVYRNAKLSGSYTDADLAQQWKQKMEAYKNTFPPYRPEELIHRTRDGNYVRSRGEALIYNYLLDIGVPFIYELPLRIRFENKDRLLLPDFTILSEIDYKTIIFIEHQGMMSDPYYRNKFNDSVYKYWFNNYIPERDVFFTFDLPNGGFDDTPIRSIIRRYIRPDYNPD